MSKMTPWFPPHIKPVHKGVYQVEWHNKESDPWPTYAQWNGYQWSRLSCHKTDGFWHNCYEDAKQARAWRGFTEKQT